MSKSGALRLCLGALGWRGVTPGLACSCLDAVRCYGNGRSPAAIEVTASLIKIKSRLELQVLGRASFHASAGRAAAATYTLDDPQLPLPRVMPRPEKHRPLPSPLVDAIRYVKAS